MEDAIVQVMTYLIENETVALLVPARFLARIHPHFREIMQLLARHVPILASATLGSPLRRGCWRVWEGEDPLGLILSM